jgi:bifunctional DNase/RNase
MDILGLSTSPSSGGAYALILNETNGARRLPIIIGTYEAQAIALELEHIKPPRPMTHDLLKQMVVSFNGSLREVIISELREGTFYAQILIDSVLGPVELDARPSDAIALAIRFSSPIYVSQKVLLDAGIDAEADANAVTASPSKTPAESKSSKSADFSTLSGDVADSKIKSLEKNLLAAIAAEDYELAARLRDELLRLKG